MSVTDADTEEPDDGDHGGRGDSTPQPKGRRLSFDKVRRDLTDEELGSSGVQKVLLDELDRMDGVVVELKSVSTKYHQAKTNLAVSNEKLKTHNSFDILSTGSIAAGSILFGIAFNVKDNDKLFLVLVGISIITVLIGITAKVNRA